MWSVFKANAPNSNNKGGWGKTKFSDQHSQETGGFTNSGILSYRHNINCARWRRGPRNKPWIRRDNALGNRGRPRSYIHHWRCWWPLRRSVAERKPKIIIRPYDLASRFGEGNAIGAALQSATNSRWPSLPPWLKDLGAGLFYDRSKMYPIPLMREMGHE